jgi:hypothetical protein
MNVTASAHFCTHREDHALQVGASERAAVNFISAPVSNDDQVKQVAAPGMLTALQKPKGDCLDWATDPCLRQ